MNTKKVLSFVQIFLVISLSFVFILSFNSSIVNADEQQVCCEKDNGGNFCNYVPSSECTGAGVLKAATSCDQTSFCKAGCCAGVNGFCYNNYPKAMCEKKYGGSFTSEPNCGNVNECKLGCCIIGTQAAYLTRGRCIEETSKYPDLEVDFKDNVNSEQECLNLAKNTEKGCCVTDDKKCKYGAKSECNVQNIINGTGFYKDTFCGSLKNNCDCASADKSNPRATMCLSNDDKVYWKDSCGNPEGIVSGIDLTRYGGAKPDGNCDFNQGNLCGDSNKDGINVCESLDCENTKGKENGKLSIRMLNYNGKGTDAKDVSTDGVLNGEGWCEYDSPDQIQKFNGASTADREGKDPIGSRYYRHLCINGQEIVEPCKDLREEYCYAVSGNIDVSSSITKKYTESRCVTNNWKPCVDQCNTANPATMDQYTYPEALKKDQACCLGANRDCYWSGNKCVPAVSPGFKFWEAEGANICAKANTQCNMLFRCGGWNKLLGACSEEKKAGGKAGVTILAGVAGVAVAWFLTGGVAAIPMIIGGGGSLILIGASQTDDKAGWQIVSGGECLSQDYLQASNNYCRSLGDCGADFNYLNSYGGIDKKFTLGTSGFSTSGLGNKELEDYAMKNQELIKQRKSNPDRKNIEIDFVKSEGVPGKLINDPDWTKGGDFYNFNLEKKELSNQFVRALFGSPYDLEISAGGFFSGPAGLGVITSVLGGIVGGAMFSGAGAGAAGFGTGFSSSPLGFLVSKLVSFIPGETASKLGFKLGEKTFAEEVGKKAGEKATDAASAEIRKKAIDASTSKYIEVEKKAIDRALDAGKDEINKASKQALDKLAQTGTDESLQEATIEKVSNAATDKAKDVIIEKTKKEGAEQFKGEANKAFDQTRDQLTKKTGDTAKEQVTKQASTFSQVMTGVSAAMWVYTAYQLGDVLLEGTQQVTISTTCQAWQAPSYKANEAEDPCQKCNPQYNPGKENGYVNADKTPKDVRAFKKCSEYRCKSLGQSCELINKGTTEENCVSISKLDVNAPKIEPWFDVFTLNITGKDVQVNQNGFIVKKKIPIYAPFSMGIKTDEPSQCKMSFDHSKRYADMENNFFGGNLFNYFHLNTMIYPASKANSTVNGTTVSTLKGGGHYKLYMRCLDASGNANENDYSIEFDVSDEPDLTAPNIVGSSISPPEIPGLGRNESLTKEVYLMNGANYTDITLFVNEPSECRYSYVPLDFSFMNATNSCKSISNLPDAPPYYACKFIRGVNSLAGIGPAPSGFTSKSGMVQYIYFKCRDHPEAGYTGARNFNKEPYTIILRGSDNLDIAGTSPSGLIKTSNNLIDVTLQVSTIGGAELNGKSICKYTTDKNNAENLASMTEFLNTGSSTHTQPWQPSSGQQAFYIGCYDKAGNRKYTSLNFTVEKDVSAPFITKVYRDQSFQPPQFIVEINEAGECKDSIQDTFDFSLGGNLMNSIGTGNKVFSSTVTDSNLYYLVCRDQFNNTMSAATVQIAQV